MLFDFKALASALLLSTAVFGAAVEHLGKGVQPKGIDVSSHQSDIKSGPRVFPSLTSRRPKKPVRAMVSSSRRTPTFDSSIQERVFTSLSTLISPMLVSFEVPISLQFLTSPLALRRQSFRLQRWELEASPSQAPLTSNVWIAFLPPLRFTD
jgi:hypothetical protein